MMKVILDYIAHAVADVAKWSLLQIMLLLIAIMVVTVLVWFAYGVEQWPILFLGLATMVQVILLWLGACWLCRDRQ